MVNVHEFQPECFKERKAEATLHASLPEMRMTPKPPRPAGVDSAAIVSPCRTTETMASRAEDHRDHHPAGPPAHQDRHADLQRHETHPDPKALPPCPPDDGRAPPVASEAQANSAHPSA